MQKNLLIILIILLLTQTTNAVELDLNIDQPTIYTKPNQEFQITITPTINQESVDIISINLLDIEKHQIEIINHTGEGWSHTKENQNNHFEGLNINQPLQITLKTKDTFKEGTYHIEGFYNYQDIKTNDFGTFQKFKPNSNMSNIFKVIYDITTPVIHEIKEEFKNGLIITAIVTDNNEINEVHLNWNNQKELMKKIDKNTYQITILPKENTKIEYNIIATDKAQNQITSQTKHTTPNDKPQIQKITNTPLQPNQDIFINATITDYSINEGLEVTITCNNQKFTLNQLQKNIWTTTIGSYDQNQQIDCILTAKDIHKNTNEKEFTLKIPNFNQITIKSDEELLKNNGYTLYIYNTQNHQTTEKQITQQNQQITLLESTNYILTIIKSGFEEIKKYITPTQNKIIEITAIDKSPPQITNIYNQIKNNQIYIYLDIFENTELDYIKKNNQQLECIYKNNIHTCTIITSLETKTLQITAQDKHQNKMQEQLIISTKEIDQQLMTQIKINQKNYFIQTSPFIIQQTNSQENQYIELEYKGQATITDLTVKLTPHEQIPLSYNQNINFNPNEKKRIYFKTGLQNSNINPITLELIKNNQTIHTTQITLIKPNTTQTKKDNCIEISPARIELFSNEKQEITIQTTDTCNQTKQNFEIEIKELNIKQQTNSLTLHTIFTEGKFEYTIDISYQINQTTYTKTQTIEIISKPKQKDKIKPKYTELIIIIILLSLILYQNIKPKYQTKPNTQNIEPKTIQKQQPTEKQTTIKNIKRTIETIEELYKEGILSKEEFEEEKQKIEKK
jgi:hypothetical protein